MRCKMLYCNTHVHILLSELSEFRSKKTNQFRRMLYTNFYFFPFAYVKAAELRKAVVSNSHKYGGVLNQGIVKTYFLSRSLVLN